MEYTIQKLAQLAGISTRTLRYYDELGILKPTRINSSGYRIYRAIAVDRLQQILFYKELGVSLESIKEILSSPDFDFTKALKEHREKLIYKRAQLDLLILNVDKTIRQKEGEIIMNDNEKFEGFKQKTLRENEEKYGEEARAKYGNESVESANQKFNSLTQEQHKAAEKLSSEILETLSVAFKTGDPAGELAQKAADLHRQWLCYFWNTYTKEAHAGLGELYVQDARFTAYYDKVQPGSAKFFRDAILVYTLKGK